MFYSKWTRKPQMRTGKGDTDSRPALLLCGEGEEWKLKRGLEVFHGGSAR